MVPLTYSSMRKAILAVLPHFPGWDQYDNGQAPVSDTALPPWIIISIKDTGRPESEAIVGAAREATLEMRVVGTTELGVNIIAEKLHDKLDALTNIDPRISLLAPLRDSGSYPSDLTNPQTNLTYQMRVLTWHFTWNAI